MRTMRARDVLLEVLRSEGVRHVFGNPGSTELPLIDALAGAEDLAYVLALQEATAVAMADAYAWTTGRAAFLNLHTAAGLGNAIGNLTNAQVIGSPLVVTAGQQDTRHVQTDPLLSGDLVGLARSVSKWAHELRSSWELGTYLRRAFQDAASAPTGPVFLSLPMDLLDQEVASPAPPTSRLARDAVGGGLTDAADLLLSTPPGRLAIVVGDEAVWAGAIPAVARLAEVLGAPVHGSPLHATGVFYGDHPLWQGGLPLAAAQVHAVLAAYDRVLLVGGQAFMAYPYTEGSPVPTHVELIHLSPAAHHLGRFHPVTLGVVGDPAATLAALLPLLEGRADPSASDRVAEAARDRASKEEVLADTARARLGATPVHPMAAVHAVLGATPTDAVVVDEAITNGVYVAGFHRAMAPGRYLRGRGGGLGWGMPAAVGAALGSGRPVLCVVGDGSAMYSPQALWSAANLRLPVVFVVVNNRQYLILKSYLRGMQGDSVRTGRFVGMDLDDPAVDYVGLARSLGVAGVRVEDGHTIADAVSAAFDTGRPHLIEVPVAAP
jgi:benzoylformate decarboxylase